MKFKIFIYALLILILPGQEKKDSKELKAKSKIAAVMGMMHLPSMGVSHLLGKDDYSSKYFKKAAGDFVQKAAEMADVKHPDSDFQIFNKEMLQALKPFEQAVKNEDLTAIKKSWSKLMQTCSDCHSVYHVKKK